MLCATFMRIFNFIVLFFLCPSIFGQSIPRIKHTTLNNSSDLKDKAIYESVNKIKLPDLSQCKDSFHFRFSEDRWTIDIWTNDYVTFYGRLLKFMNTHNKTPVKYYSQAIKVDTTIARSIYELFLKYSIFQIPNQEDIKGWINGLDGSVMTIVYATPTTYSFKKYWSPNAYPYIKEAVAIDSIHSKLYKVFTDLEMSAPFLCFLPPGLYEVGDLIMSCTLTKPKRKTKRNQK